MPLSSLTAIAYIAEGSEATPGLWNAQYSTISTNLAELNNKAIGLASGLVLNGTGTPNSAQTQNVGFLWERVDSPTTQHPLYVKRIGSGNTGWYSDAGFMGDAGEGQGAIQVGPGSSANALNSIALATNALTGANANQAVALGFGSTVTGSGAIGVGANANVYNPNGVGVGINAYVGFQDGGAFGSNVTSNATGAYTLGAYGINSAQSSLLLTSRGTTNTAANACLIDYDTVMAASVFSSGGTIHFATGDGRLDAQVTIAGSNSSFTVVGQSIGVAYLRDRTNGAGAVVAWDRFVSANPTIVATVGSASSFTFGAPNATQIQINALSSPGRLEAKGGSSRTSFQLDFIGMFFV